MTLPHFSSAFSFSFLYFFFPLSSFSNSPPPPPLLLLPLHFLLLVLILLQVPCRLFFPLPIPPLSMRYLSFPLHEKRGAHVQNAPISTLPAFTFPPPFFHSSPLGRPPHSHNHSHTLRSHIQMIHMPSVLPHSLPSFPPCLLRMEVNINKSICHPLSGNTLLPSSLYIAGSHVLIGLEDDTPIQSIHRHSKRRPDQGPG